MASLVSVIRSTSIPSSVDLTAWTVHRVKLGLPPCHIDRQRDIYLMGTQARLPDKNRKKFFIDADLVKSSLNIRVRLLLIYCKNIFYNINRVRKYIDYYNN